MTDDNHQPHLVRKEGLPDGFPTNTHDARFWEALGRCVATFGHLEMTLIQAHFAFSGMREVSEENVQKELKAWAQKLQSSLKSTLHQLIDIYISSIKNHADHKIDELDNLENDLRKITVYRNVLCHAKWGFPGADGKCVPYFINKHDLKFDTPIGLAELVDIQKHSADLIVAVINSVTIMGWQFPGSKGPGRPLFA